MTFFTYRMDGSPGKLTAKLLDAAVELMGRSGRGGAVRVQGRSMVPTLVPGQLLAVEFSPPRLRRGDLLLFRQQDYLVVHRLLGPGRLPGGGRCLKTRGDGVPVLDPPVDGARVVGRVTAVEQAGGTWVSLAGAGPRAYAACLAAHDRLWALAVALGERCDSALKRLRLRTPFRWWAEALDRRLLAWAHGTLFHRLHRPTPRPPEAGAAGTAAGSAG